MLYILKTALELGLLYALVPMALFLSFRVLNIADLTTDGCFVFGAAVSVQMAAIGQPILGIPLAMAAGALAGFITAFIHTKMKVPSILAGIITNTGLYTINLMVMGWSSNVSLLKKNTIYSMFKSLKFLGDWSGVVLTLLIVALVAFLLISFLGTRLGLSIRATGDNIDMVRASSINPTFTITVGLCLANAMTALSGAMVGQYQKTVDINGGTGIVVIGLACLIIGETVTGRRSVRKGAIAAIVGSIIYRIIYAVCLYTKVIPVEFLKLLTAAIVAVAIAFPALRKMAAFQKKKMEHTSGRAFDQKGGGRKRCLM